MPLIADIDVPEEIHGPRVVQDAAMGFLGTLGQFAVGCLLLVGGSMYSAILGAIGVLYWGLIAPSVRRYVAPLKVSSTRGTRMPRLDMGVFRREDH